MRSLKSNLVKIMGIGTGVFLFGCVTSQENVETVGGVEYSGTALTAKTGGQALVTHFHPSNDWGAAVAPPSGPEIYADLSAKMTVLKKPSAMAKGSADFPGAQIELNLKDTANGIAHVYVTITGVLKTTYDTASVRWDEKARDDIKDNENIIRAKSRIVHVGGKVETVEFTDADGDGIVNADSSGNSKVKLVTSTTMGGETEEAILVVSAGADYNFQADKDNSILTAKWSRTKAGIETAHAEYMDADGDGIVIDNGNGKPYSTVHLKYWEMNPKGKPFVNKISADAWVKVFAQGAGDEPISFSFREEMKSGRVNTVTMKNGKGGDDILRGDTLLVYAETHAIAKDDTLRSLNITFAMNPGQDLKSEEDDTLYSFHVRAEKKVGFEKEAEFNFTAGEPVPHGQKPQSGNFDLLIKYHDGSQVSLIGSFSETGYEATFIDAKGNTSKVEYDKAGTLLAEHTSKI